MLHPAQVPEHGDRLVRWAEVAAWNRMPLRRDAQFCLWDGYGWESASSFGPMREAPRVQLPHRGYLLYFLFGDHTCGSGFPANAATTSSMVGNLGRV